MLIEVIDGYWIKKHTYGNFVVNNVREEKNEKGVNVTVYDTIPCSNADFTGCLNVIAKEIISKKDKTTVKDYIREYKEIEEKISKLTDIK